MDSDITNNNILHLNMVFPLYFQKCKTVVLMNQQDKKIRSCNLDQFMGGEMTAESSVDMSSNHFFWFTVWLLEWSPLTSLGSLYPRMWHEEGNSKEKPSELTQP